MKIKTKHPTNRVLISIVVVLLGLQAGILWYFGQKIEILWEQSGNKQQYPLMKNPDMGYLVQSSVRGLYTNSGVVDIKKDKIYIPELKVYVPFSQLARDLRYIYTLADKSDPKFPVDEQVSLTTEQILNRPLLSFDQVPCLQRFIGVTVNGTGSYTWSSDSESKEIDTVLLNDGRKLHIFQNSNQKCSNFWSENLANDTVALLKQAKSY